MDTDAEVPSALARMGLVDDDGNLAAPVLVADGVQDEGNFCTVVMTMRLPSWEQSPQVAGGLGVADDGAYLSKLLDGVPYLPVQHPAVGDDDYGIEDGRIVPLQPDQLVGQPCDGVGLAAPRRV